MVITELPPWEQLEMADLSYCVDQFNYCTLKSSSDSYETSPEKATGTEGVSPSIKPPTDKDDENRLWYPAKPQRQLRRVAAQQGDDWRKVCMFKLDDCYSNNY